MRKMPWEEGFDPADINLDDDGAPDLGAVSTGAMARLAELPAESDALSAGNTKTLDKVGDASFPEADELAPKPPPRVPMSAPGPDLPAPVPRPAFLDGAPSLDDAPHVAKPLEAAPEEYSNESAPLGNVPKLTGDLSLKSQRVLGPKDVAMVGRPAPGPVDAPEDAVAAGAKRDRMNQLMRAIELGGKQANAGLGGGPVGALVTEKSDFEGDARKEADTAATKAQAKALDERNFAEKQAEERRRIIEADRRARKDKVDADREDARLRADGDREQAREGARATEFGETKRHNLATEAIGTRNANRPAGGAMVEDDDGNMVPVTEARLSFQKDKYGASVGAPEDWLSQHPEDRGKTFPSPDEGAKFRSQLALNKQSHDHIRTMTDAYRVMRQTATSDPARAAQARADFEVAMEALIPKITGAEGMTPTIDSLNKIKSALSANGVINAVAKASDPEFVPRLLGHAGETIDVNIRNAAKVQLEHRGKGARAAQASADDGLAPHPDKPVKMRFPDGSEHVVSPADLDLARKKGGVPLG